MRTVGLDISTKTGMAIVDAEEQRGTVVTLPKITGFQRVQLVAGAVEQTLKIWQPQRVMVEGYAYCKNINSFVILVELGTAIRLMLHRNNWAWYDVTPATLKKWTTGKGNASKNDMAQAVWHKWCYTSESDDIVDAIALARLGQLPSEELLKISGITANF